MIVVVVLAHVDAAVDAERVEHAARRARAPPPRASLSSTRRRVERSAGSVRDDACRLVADAEQAALALGDDLELHRRLVERPDAAARARAAPPTSPRRPSRRSPRPSSSPSLTAAAGLLLPAHLARRLPARACRRRLRRAGSRLRAVPAAVAAVVSAASASAASRASRRRRLRHEAPRDQPLADRPEVRRHPVEDEAGREVRDHEHEDERHHHEEVALHLVDGRRHVERRRHLASHVDDEQHEAAPVRRRLVRDRRDEVQEREVARMQRRGLLREVPQRRSRAR